MACRVVWWGGMRGVSRAVAMTVGCVVLAGCAVPPTRPQAPPPQFIENLKSGHAILDCRDGCLDEWRGAQPRAAQLDAAGQWNELATLVIGIGFQDDLTLYYLGRAAEGLGALPAARAYYGQSTQVSATARACRSFSGNCGGVSLPRAASSRVAAINRVLGRPAPAAARPPHPAAPRAAPRAPAPIESTRPISTPAGRSPPVEFPLDAPSPIPEPPAVQAPSPSASAAPQSVPPPARPSEPITAAPAGAGAPTEFIEPPPAPQRP